jgi:hypothetical protein
MVALLDRVCEHMPKNISDDILTEFKDVFIEVMKVTLFIKEDVIEDYVKLDCTNKYNKHFSIGYVKKRAMYLAIYAWMVLNKTFHVEVIVSLEADLQRQYCTGDITEIFAPMYTIQYLSTHMSVPD